ncbi:Fe2+-dicitrate sensor, membrane protein [Flammeovirgaceae bacterium 311]|nr:Fe2+-dicitrate sensor, membrane protein [Flammeovirgaceae bacterium 311]
MDLELLQKFYRGECSEEEVQKVLSWFASKEQKDEMLEQLESQWEEFEEPKENSPDGYQPEKVLNAIHARIQLDDKIQVKEARIRQLHGDRFYPLKVASVVLLAIVASFVILKFTTPSTQSTAISYISTEVPAGQKKTIRLADGTVVVLNAASKLVYPEKFAANSREIELEGEAFFKVARDIRKPFTVKSGEVVTKVLGTSFNIRAYRAEADIEVAVATGKVNVSHGDEAHNLLPGELVQYNAETKSLNVQEYDHQEVLAWKEGIIYFKDATYEEVKSTLERWYGVEIHSDAKVDNWQYTGSFKNENLKAVLMSIGYVKEFDFNISGKNVEIDFKNSGH